jgi:hypothetical protein
MRTNTTRRLGLAVFILLFTVVTGCKWPEATYNEIDSIRKEALELVEKSGTENYSAHQQAVEKLNARMNTLIAVKKPKIGVTMLQAVIDENKKTWGGFVKMWAAQGTLSPAAVPAVKQRVDQAFIEVLGLGKKEHNLSIFN